ncbi:myosin-3-like [Morone saxatilis]|uniref:myosin-3-like n=1 Tax=Morone saxatilis TaxID=34816 RepID=UPI0015E1F10E|nr:myosin-3-like [Morone saxatilis]
MQRDQRCFQRTSGQQAGGRARQDNEVHQKVEQLEARLCEERTKCFTESSTRLQYGQELEDAKLQKQKTLKEMYINREKETSRELEKTTVSYRELSLQYETEVTAVKQQAEPFPQELSQEINQKTLLQQQYEDLQVKFAAEQVENKNLEEEMQRISVSHHGIILRYESELTNVTQQAETLQHQLDQEIEQKTLLQNNYEDLKGRFEAELQAEQDKNKILEEELQRINASYHDVSFRYETYIITATQQVETLQRELDQHMKSHADMASEGWCIIDDLRDEWEEEISILRQNTIKTEMFYKRELEELKTQLSAQISLNLQLSIPNAPAIETMEEAEVSEEKPCKQQESITNAPTSETIEEAEGSEEKPCKQQESITNAPTSEPIEEAEGSEERQPKTPSKWQRIHFLGLRKPQSWKK